MRLRHLFATVVLCACGASGQALVGTLAGTGTCSYTGDGGPAAQATLCNPQGALTDGFGDIYLPDTANYVIRKITPAGVISTIAGTGIRGTSDQGGPALGANLGIFYQIGYDGSSNLCFGDDDIHKIRCVLLTNGTIFSFGTGNPVSAGDGGAYYNASFNQPVGIAFVPQSKPPAVWTDIYISDSNDNIVRKIDGSTGLISTVVGPGTPGQLGDGGPGTSASLLSPGALTYFNGSIYIADTLNNRIRQWNLSTGLINTVAGNGVPYFAGDGGPATAAQLMSPGEVTFDSVGNLYITDRGNERIRKVDASGIITTVAGNGSEGAGQDNIPATQTSFAGLGGAFWNSPANQLLISDGGNKLRQVTYQASTTSLALTPNPVAVGSPITMTVTVSPSSATGLVNFYVNFALIASVPVSAGQASTTWTASGANPVMQAVYEGDLTYGPSLSQELGESVQLKPTTNVLVATPNPSAPSQPVTLTATITPAVATGTVTFYANGAVLGSPSLVNGVATVTTSFSSKGTVTINTFYGGDNTYGSSYSSLTQSVLVSTTTTVTSSQNPAGVGAPVTFTASVSPSSTFGTVQFLDGATVLGTANLSSGVATFTTSTLTQGTHSITAVYSGDSGDSGSTSSAISQAVNAKASTVTTLTSSQNPSSVGGSITLVATVSPAAATGTIQFLDGATVLGTVTLASGAASYSTSALAQGSHSITAAYGGDANDAASTSVILSQAVKRSPGLMLVSSLNPSVVGQNVTFTANVNAAAMGTIQFLDGSATLATVPVSSGVASYSSSSLSQGAHGFSAVYSGDTTYLGATSATTTQTVNAKTSTTTTVTSTANPAFVGAAVTLQASVSPAGATGTVQFLDGATVLGTVTVANGSASFSTSSLTQGSHSIAAAYSGDATNASSASAGLSQTINAQSVSTTTVVSTQNPSPVGGPVTFLATVSPAAATGTVQFLDGASVLGTVTLANGSGSFTTSALTQGTHSITAAYGGDAGDTASNSGALSQAVKLNSGLTLVSSLNPSVAGQSVSFTVNVNPAATGTVQFSDGSVVLGTVPVSSGAATYSTSTLTQGAHAISVVYSGDANYLSLGSAAMTQTVNAKTATSTTVGSSQNPGFVGTAVTLTATVSPATATGTVQFLDGAAVLSTAPLAGGSASFSTTLGAGVHSISVVYSGDAVDLGSTSAVLTETINVKATTTTLTSLPNPAFVATAVTFSATVSPATATGTVQFLDGGTVLGIATLASGSASFTTSALAQGTHSMTAVYSGDTADAGSTSTPLSQVMKNSAGLGVGITPSPAVVGQAVKITANMNSAATGTVQFTDGGTVLATVPVSAGTASFSTSTLAPGMHLLGVAYSGDANYMSASTSFNETVLAASSVLVGSNLNPSMVGQSVTLIASVTPSTATGTVQFFDGGTAIGTASVVSGIAAVSTASLAKGTHSISATYSGDAADAPASSGSLAQVVKAVTSVSLSSSLNPSDAGKSVSFSVSVTPSTATGTVQFLDGGTVLSTVTLSSGTAAFATTQLAAGTHSITATYGGDSLDTAAVSTVLTQTVNATAPGAPSNLTATASGSSQINLAWTASATSGVTYDVYQSTSSGFTPSPSNLVASSVGTTSYSATGLNASTSYYYRVTAVKGGVASAATNQASATTAGGLSCQVSYSVTTQWNVGFTGAISIQNTGSAPINNWVLTWTWPGSQALTESWNASYQESGKNVTLTYESYNKQISAGATLSGVGFNGSYSGSNPAPTAFYVNGTLCH